jgi:hypothetical protein
LQRAGIAFFGAACCHLRCTARAIRTNSLAMHSLVPGVPRSGNYDQMWFTTSLRGMVGGDLTVEVLSEGVHSGSAPHRRSPRPASAPGLGSPRPHRRRDRAHPCPHLHRDWALLPTSAPGLGSPRTHLHRDWAPPCHICTGTYASAGLRRESSLTRFGSRGRSVLTGTLSTHWYP